MKVSATILCLAASTAYAFPKLVARQAKDECGFRYTIHKFPKDIVNQASQDPNLKYYKNIAPVIAKFSEECLISKKPWSATNKPRCGKCSALSYQWEQANPATPVKIHGTDIRDGNDFILVNHMFFIKAPEEGEYKFTAIGPQDDITLLYLGPKALNGYTYENADLKSEWFTQDENKTPDGKKDKSITRQFKKDQVIPVRIISVNGQRTGSIFNFHIVDPKGRCILGPKTTKGKTPGIFQTVGDQKFPEFPYTIQPLPGIAYTIHRIPSTPNDANNKYYNNIKPAIEGISKDTNPLGCGNTNRLGFEFNEPNTKQPVLIYKTKITDSNEYFIVSHNFFLKVPTAGEYTFTAVGRQDDLTLLWVGDKALAGFTYDNNNLISEYFTAGENNEEGQSKSYRKTYNAGDVVPVRIIAVAAQGASVFKFKITGPEGVGQLVGPTTKRPECKHIFSTDPGQPGQSSGGAVAPTGGQPPLPKPPTGPTGIKVFPTSPFVITPFPPDEDAGGY